MPRDNVEVIRQLIAAIDRRDRDAWFALHDPETEFRAAAEWPESETVRGREAVWEFIVSLVDPWEPTDWEMAEAVEAGSDTLAVRIIAPVRGRASGVVNELDYWSVSTFRAGKILRNHWFTNRAEALEAAGLRE